MIRGTLRVPSSRNRGPACFSWRHLNLYVSLLSAATAAYLGGLKVPLARSLVRPVDPQVVAALAVVPFLLMAQASALAENNAPFPHGYYTDAQAQAGKATFDRVCAICHGSHLQGKVGPALAGKQFLSVSQFQQVTAYYFFHFMAKQMPQNAPGSLSQAQYLDLMAYLLQVNGYAAGSHELTTDSTELKEIKIEPQH